MKSFNFTCSILQNTNRIISASQCNFNSVPAGSFFRFLKDKNFYTVLKSNNIFLNYDFELDNPRKIIINKDIGVNLSKNDSIKILYKEYEILTVLRIVNSGNNYKQNDIIYLVGGIPSINLENNEKIMASFRVAEIDEKGGIKQISLNDKGRYAQPTESIVNIFGGNGNGAELEVEFQVIDDKSIIERQILMINYLPQYSEIFIDYPLPNGIKKGSISCNKYELLLNSNYLESTKRNEEYEISRDFSPYLRLPLMSKNSFSTDLIYNNGMLILENKIKELEEKIDLLNKK